MTRTLICLARHGETNWNIERRFQGQFDIALNARGRAQAAALARELSSVHFDRIYSSDLRRAMATAAPMAAARGLQVLATQRLREKDDGAWQGHTHSEVQVKYADVYPLYLSRKPDFAAPEGETLEEFARRVRLADRHCEGKRRADRARPRPRRRARHRLAHGDRQAALRQARAPGPQRHAQLDRL